MAKTINGFCGGMVNMPERFVSYDIKGIQKSIFAVPRLKTIVGGSAMIDRFDAKIAVIANEYSDAKQVFAGGGKGILAVKTAESATELIKRLVVEAHSIGLSLRVGNESSLEAAMIEANQLYPFIPEKLEGHPCKESGLYPVEGDNVHEIIAKRTHLGEKDPVGNRILKLMRDLNVLPEKLVDKNLSFVKSIDVTDKGMGVAGSKLFQDRKRWAVIAMDGNDVGKQFRSYKGSDRKNWAKKVSSAIKDCTQEAFAFALGETLAEMGKEFEFPTYTEVVNGKQHELTVLPFRPLILGGDDILVLAHTSVAMLFVRKIVSNFERLTEEAEIRNTGDALWPGSEGAGKLTISAGIVYIGTSYPLHTAIEYADELLSGAKSKNRQEGKITPSAVDWENITEGFIDTPAERRYRELVFIDNDLDGDRIELTCRPYTIEKLEKNLIPLSRKITDSSRSAMTGLLSSMKKPWAERVLYFSAFVRHDKNRWIQNLLDESNPKKPGDGWILNREQKLRRTMIPDALLLVEEEHRITGGGENDNA